MIWGQGSPIVFMWIKNKYQILGLIEKKFDSGSSICAVKYKFNIKFYKSIFIY